MYGLAQPLARPFSSPRNSHRHRNDLESHVRTSGARKRKYRDGWQMVEGALLTVAKEQADRQAGSADATIGTVTRDDSLECNKIAGFGIKFDVIA